jgi:hypothetical protein
MDSSNPAINPSNPATRLERFKAVCLEKRMLKENIEKLMEKRETCATREFERAESELERIRASATDVRAQLEQTRLAEVDSTVKSEEATSHTSNGPLNPALPSKTADLEGDRPSLLNGSVVKDSTRNSISFKSAESPILSPESDEYSAAGSPYHPSFPPDPRSEDCNPTIPIAEEYGQSCAGLLKSQAQRYADLCEERRDLERKIEEELVQEEEMALAQVESARSSLREVKETIVEIRATLKTADEGNTVMNIPPTDSIDGLQGENGIEGTLSPATTIHPHPSEPRVRSISNASTHDNPPASVHIPESSRESHLPRATQLSSEETHATGSQIASVHKTRKRLTKKGYKQIERSRVVPQDEAAPVTPLFQKVFSSSFVGGE